MLHPDSRIAISVAKQQDKPSLAASILHLMSFSLELFTRNFAYYTLELFEGHTSYPIDELMILVEGRLKDNWGWLMMVACYSRR